MNVLRGIGRAFTAGEMGVIERACIVCEGDRVVWVGPERDLDAALADVSAGVGRDEEIEEHDCDGALVTPGLVDAHTHPLYAGERFAEIAARSAGARYLEVAQAGGGIAATVQATRAASDSTLRDGVVTRLRSWLAGGTTSLEAKTGYHLNEEGELSAVRLLAELARTGAERGQRLPRVDVTFLGAHAVAPERAGDQSAYVEDVVGWCAAAAAAGARHCDVFCDEGYFTVEESRRILEAGRRAGLLPRLHADELAHTGGAMLAAEIGALSADHLLWLEEPDARALARAGVTATLAPATALSMGHPPPARTLLDAGAHIALATDHNPGTCGTTSMSLVVALAITGLHLSVEEALLAATAGGARSLGHTDRGRIGAGMLADLVEWDADHEGAFGWAYGLRPRRIWLGGERVDVSGRRAFAPMGKVSRQGPPT
jgi:imidazolonepropionase